MGIGKTGEVISEGHVPSAASIASPFHRMRGKPAHESKPLQAAAQAWALGRYRWTRPNIAPPDQFVLTSDGTVQRDRRRRGANCTAARRNVVPRIRISDEATGSRGEKSHNPYRKAARTDVQAVEGLSPPTCFMASPIQLVEALGVLERAEDCQRLKVSTSPSRATLAQIRRPSFGAPHHVFSRPSKGAPRVRWPHYCGR